MDYCEGAVNDVYIILNEFNTINHDVRVLELGTKEPSSLKYELTEAYGQDGYTRVSEDAYRGFERTSSIMINNEETYDLFMDGFYPGQEVRVEYSDDKGRHRYGVISGIEDNVIIGDNREVSIKIDLLPFQYTEEASLTIVAREEVQNIGNVYATPVMTVYGTGKGKLYVNDQIMELDVDEFLVIDNEGIDVFDKDGLRANSRRLSGNFFRLRPGENIINFDGLISKVGIGVEWRWR